MALIAILSVAWVVTYGLLGLYAAAAMPFAYQVIAVISLVALSRGWDFDRFTTLHLVSWLALPVAMQMTLGGFVSSSGVMLWALTAALAALVLVPNPIRWFVAYLVIVVASGIAEPFLDPVSVPPAVNITFFVLNVGAVSGVISFVLRYFMRGFTLERERSERLLLNILPSSVARRLKAGEEPIADHFDDVAVVFADVVDFTPLADRLPAQEVVLLLDRLFTAFDVVADRWGLEKIKTIGDAYMAVSGIPTPRPDAAEAAAGMALDMLEEVSEMGEQLGLRIGIDFGPVSAGVIGKRKFAYDLWGDTVNTASRMEFHGVPGRIQVTERAYQQLRGRYRFEARGAIEVKGKGTMSPYLLIGPIDRADDSDETLVDSSSALGLPPADSR